MKNLITADIHLKLNQKNVPQAWALARIDSFLIQFNELSALADRVSILGDTFDKLPSLDELALFFRLVDSLDKPTDILDGNHEATRKGKTFLSSLTDVVKSINPLVNIVTEVTEHEFGTYLPYCKLKEKGVVEGLNKSKPLYTHVRGEIPPHVKPEIDLALLKDFPIVYAGDLHSVENSQLNIVYPGSPMTTSFHRSLTKTGCIIAEGTNYDWHQLELPQLIRKTVSSPEDMIATDYHHTIYELEGSMDSLVTVENSDLLDKKIMKRSSETALILRSDMTMEEELYEYLVYILEIGDAEAKNIIGVYRDNVKES